MQHVELPATFHDEVITTLPPLSFRFQCLSSSVLHVLALHLSNSMTSFEAFVLVKLKHIDLRVVTQCSFVSGCEHFGVTGCFKIERQQILSER
jgi:hypothetical protein